MNSKKYKIENWRSISAVVFFLIFWEIIPRFGLVDELFVSLPSKIIIAGYKLVLSGVFIGHFFASIEILLSGLFFAIMIGFIAGLMIGSSEKIKQYLHPFIFSLNAMPMIAMMPLIILWFGTGLNSKVIIVFILAVVPILTNTIDGVVNTDKNIIHMVNSYGADKKFILLNVFLYSSLPQAFSGLRSGIGRGIIGVVLADMFGSGNGLGYLVSIYGNSFQTARLMFILLSLLMISLTLTSLVDTIERRIIIWNK